MEKTLEETPLIVDLKKEGDFESLNFILQETKTENLKLKRENKEMLLKL